MSSGYLLDASDAECKDACPQENGSLVNAISKAALLDFSAWKSSEPRPLV
jgi:hypothetical protein